MSLLFFFPFTAAARYPFISSVLSGTEMINPTSLQFGRDGRLYVSVKSGLIYIHTIRKEGPCQFRATDTEIIDIITRIPNHNDDGSRFDSIQSRQVTGILVAGTVSRPVIYVSSSDPRIGGGGDQNDLNLDTNSGIVSRLTWNGKMWEKVDLVRGLPRSEENHSVNGMQLDPVSNTLYLAVGGNTNAGAPSYKFAYLNEYALSAAIVKIDLNKIDAMPVRGEGANQYVYDIPTLNDPTRPDIKNPDYDPSLSGSPVLIDTGDPFGGNDGRNMAILVPGGPVQIHSPGYRNAYDLVLTALPGRSGRLYTIDNGANTTWGGYPYRMGTKDVTNEYIPGEPGSTESYYDLEEVNNKDNFHLVSKPGMSPIYGGHPNPIRANPGGAGLSWSEGETTLIYSKKPTSDWPPLPENFGNPAESAFLMPGEEDGALAVFKSSTNGLCEYRSAKAFDGHMLGNIIAIDFYRTLWRMELNEAGDRVIKKDFIAREFGEIPLDVTSPGDGEMFEGTIWVCDFSSGKIHVFEPSSDPVRKYYATASALILLTGTTIFLLFIRKKSA